VIVACWKWAPAGHRTGGISPSDEAALEVALRLAEASRDDVTVVSVAPAAAERALREALAAGAGRAVRVEAPCGLASPAVAAAIAEVAVGARWVVCGDASADRGTGSVPAFLAAETGVAQALGLVAVELVEGARVRAVRRLDGGRREVLAVAPPAVLSVEGSVARLRRAALTAELESRHAVIEVVPGPRGPVEEAPTVSPYRPRPRERPAPTGDPLGRIRALTATGSEPSVHTEVVTLDPAAAAARIIAALRGWGYLKAGSDEFQDH
jgi:electron transfer flavoprotein beta subunit